MDEDQLAELEMHLAAGTDIPTAFAAVQRDEPAPSEPLPSFRAAWIMMAIIWILALVLGAL